MERHQPASMASIKFDESSRSLRILPKQNGDLTARLVDLCLTARRNAEAVVRISGAHLVALSVENKVCCLVCTLYVCVILVGFYNIC